MVRLQGDTLIDIIKKHKLKKIAEIGVWKSKTMKKVLRANKEFNTIDEYWAIDQWKSLPKQGYGRMSKVSPEQWDGLYNHACVSLRYFPQLKVLKMTSKEASELFYKEYFDLVFIDADHYYEEIAKDIRIWYPLVRKGGYLTGHDYNSNRHKGVRKAVDEILGKVWVEKETFVWAKKI